VRKRIYYLIVSGLLNVTFCVPAIAQTLGFSLMGGKKKAEIPVEIYNNLVVVPVVLNGTLPLKFILDTGVRTAILTQKSFSDILNLAYTRKFTITGPGGEKMVDAYITNNVSLTLPGVQGRGHALLVLEEDYLELRNYLGTDVHGILGYELFSRFIVEVDYERKVVILYSPEAFRKPRRFHTLPINIEDTKPYAVVKVILPGGTVIDAKLLMDSGASHALLLDPLSDDRIQLPPNTVSSSIGRGIGGDITGKAGRVESLSLGTAKLSRVITNFPDPNSYVDTSMVRIFRHGTLGGEIMSRFTMIYDFPKEKIYFKKNSHFKKSFYYNLSGLTVKSKGAKLNVFEITDVREESVAYKAGLVKGDQILSINGSQASNVDLPFVLALLNSKPGKKIKMEISRDGKKQKIEFRLSDQI
jgi:hypothetical protein